MVVSVSKTSGAGSFQGGRTAVISYSVQEDSTPKLAEDSSGGVGSITAQVVENDETIFLSGSGIELYDTAAGTATGTVRGVGTNDGEATLTVDSQLARLVVTRKAEAFNGTLGNAIKYYFGLVGITTGFTVDPTIASRPVIYIGFNDSVWTFLKQVCTAEQIEIAGVGANIFVRPLRTHTVQMHQNSKTDYDIDTSNVSLTAEAYYYNHEFVSNALVYPTDLTGDAPILEVPQGETVVEIVKTNVSMTSILAPVPSTDAAQAKIIATDGGIKKSFYFVHDGTKEVDPQTWTDLGGMLLVEIDPADDTQLKVTARGAVNPTVTSYKIAFGTVLDEETVTFGPGLVIVGSGVRTRKELVRVATGANQSFVAEDSAPTVDNPAIRTREQAFRVAAQTATAHGGPSMTIDVSAARVHRDDWDKQPGSAFNYQVLGNIAGARVNYRDTIFRIRSATVSDNGIVYSAERDTMIEDFNAVWAGASFDAFNAQWAGRTFDEFAVMPLHRE